MAKITYTKQLPNFDNFGQYDGDTLELTHLDATSFTLEDDDGTSMVFGGRDFERTDSVVTGGTITSAKFFDDEGKRIYTFEKLAVDAETVYKAFTFDKDPLRIVQGLMQGDDTVAGTKKNDSLWGFAGSDTLYGKAGSDWLYGHTGDDMLTGGSGKDRFAFLAGYDHDTVTDFDTTGTDHDFIYMDYFQFEGIVYSEADGNVTLTMASGDSLTLLDVTQAQIEADTKFFDFF